MRLILFFIFLTGTVLSQDLSKSALSKMEDEALLTLFNEVEQDSVKAERVARAYLYRAKKENDTIKMARGYDRLARIFHPQKSIQFADSLIYLTKNIKNITYPGIGYVLKATEYYTLGDLEQSSLNYLKAYDFAIKNENIALQVFLSDVLINLKMFWGNKREALELQKNRHKLVTEIDFYKELKKSTRNGADINMKDLYLENELYSISNFVLCYTELKILDSAQYYLDKGYEKLKKYKGTPSIKRSYELIFPTCNAEINFYNKKYATSLDTVNKILSKLILEKRESKLYKNLYLFKGLCLYELNQKEEGVRCLKKADSILSNSKSSLVPNHRMIYEKLLDYYSEEDKNVENKLKYLTKLIEFDSIVIKNYQFFEPTLIKGFENPELFKEKEQLIKELKSDNLKSKSIIWIVLGVLSASLVVVNLYHRKQQVYKTRFRELMNNKSNVINNKNNIKIPTDIYNDILNKLEVFEKNKHYLKSNVSINKLAKNLNTNQKYLSKVINIEKESNFSQYINNLRVTYVFEELQVNEKLKSYTIIAISMECGFKNAESFSKAFYKKYKIKPSFYLKQLSRGHII